MVFFVVLGVCVCVRLFEYACGFVILVVFRCAFCAILGVFFFGCDFCGFFFLFSCVVVEI